MSAVNILFSFLIFQISYTVHAKSLFEYGWIPKTIRGEVFILDESMNPVNFNNGLDLGKAKLDSPLPITVEMNEGKPIEKKISGKTFLKVKAKNGTPPFWIEKKESSFTFAFPKCEEFTVPSTLLKYAKTKSYYNSELTGARNDNYAGESELKLGHPVDCSKVWLPGCIKVSSGHWAISWVQSAGTSACNERYTEATSDTVCVTCNSDLQTQAGDFTRIARQSLEAADKKLTKHVPKILHDIAIGTANKCREFAPYRYRTMTPADYDAIISGIHGAPKNKSSEKVRQCKQKLEKCYKCKKDFYSVCHGTAEKCHDIETFTGWCLRGLRETLQKAGMVPMTEIVNGKKVAVTSIGSAPAHDSAPRFEKFGFENMFTRFKISTPPYFDKTKLPPGAVILYKNPYNSDDYGHAEVFTGSLYCSDHCKEYPISITNKKRVPFAIYIKTSKP